MAASMMCRKAFTAAQIAPVAAQNVSAAENRSQRVSFSGGLRARKGAKFEGPEGLKVRGLGLGLPGARKGLGHRMVVNIAAPMTFVPEPEQEVAEVEQEQEGGEFDPSKKPPFTLSDIRAAIPKHCWEKNTWKSLSYVARDVAIVFGLAAGAAAVNNWFVWPLYWLAQGTMFWALFVLGHDWYELHFPSPFLFFIRILLLSHPLSPVLVNYKSFC
jgi:hypothetical protein